MKYLRLKNIQTSKIRKNGTKPIVPLIVEKERKFGVVLEEKFISRRSVVLITGAHNSGKTRTLERLHENALDIWGGQRRAKARLWLAGIDPLGKWIDHEAGVAKWFESETAESWRKLKSWEKAERLPDFCQARKAVVFLDDAHKLSGRKLDLACRCFLAARTAVVSARDEQRIAPSLRQPLLARQPQIIRLDSEVAYDATNLLVWLLVVGAFSAGAYEAAFVLGMLRFVLRGGGAKQE